MVSVVEVRSNAPKGLPPAVGGDCTHGGFGAGVVGGRQCRLGNGSLPSVPYFSQAKEGLSAHPPAIACPRYC